MQSRSKEPVAVLVPRHLHDEIVGAYKEHREAERWDQLPDVRFFWVTEDGETEQGSEGARAVFRYFPRDEFPQNTLAGDVMRDLVRRMDSLAWVHLHSAGYDDIPLEVLAEQGITLTNSAGVHDVPVAENALAFVLAAAKRFPEFITQQREHRWQRLPHIELEGATVGIVGLGGIGLQLAHRCRALGMRVLAVKRSLDKSPRGAGYGPLPVDELWGTERLGDLLAQADFVVLAASANQSSRRMIGAAELQCMKKSAYLINVARGELVDEEALLAALRKGGIAGACLDVLSREPVPADSPWYDTPNVILTPHNAALCPGLKPRLYDLYLDNLRRFLQGDPLSNRVLAAPEQQPSE